VLTVFAILTDGLVYAAYLFLVAVGLSLIFGVMKILNVTHGSFYAFGAYGAATAVGLYFSHDWPAAGGFLFMIALAMAMARCSASCWSAACFASSTAATRS
jgi:branched-chain amino acid transport system permease protein